MEMNMEMIGIEEISLSQADEVGGGILPLIALGLFDLGMIAYDAYLIRNM
jgi:hypothetical protein